MNGSQPDSENDPGAGFRYPSAEEMDGQIPNCEIIELAGVGGMGAVYKARQLQLDRLVAVKLLPFDAASLPGQFAERFKHEARAMAQLSHPNIVTIHDFGQTGAGQFYFIMEYVGGMDLREVIRAGGVSPADALRIVRQVCDALHAAHLVGVVHRDVKPSNIMVDPGGCAKVTDFGIAKVFGAETGDLTRTGSGSLGTPGYMAPEQMLEGGTVDARTDIYSIGVLLYELLTGAIPQGVWNPPSAKAKVPSLIDQVVDRALQTEPAARYQSAADMRTDLTTAMNHLAAPEPPAAPGAGAGGGRLGKSLAIVGALAVLAAAGWIWSQHSGAGAGDETPVAVEPAKPPAGPEMTGQQDPQPPPAPTGPRELTANFDSFDEATNSIRVTGEDGAIDITFAAVSATAFADYRRGDQLTVSGEIEQWDEGGKRMRGTEVVRLANPLSRVTSQGRADPPRTYKREQAEWEAFNSIGTGEVEVGKTFSVVGEFSGAQKGTDYYVVRFENLFFEADGDAVEVECPRNQTSTRLFEESLNPNDEISATLFVSSYSDAAEFGLSSIARIDGSSLVAAEHQSDLRRTLEQAAVPPVVAQPDPPPRPEFRPFRLSSGTEFKAKPISYYRTRVRFESDKGMTADIEIGTFVPQDQAFLKQWIKQNSDKLNRLDLRVSASRPVGGNTDKIRKIKYTIKVSNGAPIALEGLEMEYKLFYEIAEGGDAVTQIESITEPRRTLPTLATGETDSFQSQELVYNSTTGEVLNRPGEEPGAKEDAIPLPVLEPPPPPRGGPGRPRGAPPAKAPKKPKLELDVIGIWVRVYSPQGELVTEYKEPRIFSDFRWDADGNQEEP